MDNELQKRIDAACANTAPGPERVKALESIKWVLATDDGKLVGTDPVKFWKTVLTRNVSEATQYSGMDNHDFKARFFMSILKQPLTVVLLDS